MSASPLELFNSHFYNPIGWYRIKNYLTTTFTIRASVGQIDFRNVKAIPQLGYTSKSGGSWNTVVNKIQGTDGWGYQARHGHDWFFWRIEKANPQELVIRLLIALEEQTPELPIYFGMTIPDNNYDTE